MYARIVAFISVLIVSVNAQATAAVPVEIMVRRVAISGQHPVGAPQQARFSTFLLPSYSGDGTTLFRGKFSGLGISINRDTGLWRGPPGNLTSVAIANQAAPDTSPGISFAGVSPPSVGNAAGDAAFAGWIQGPGIIPGSNDWGFWSGAPASPHLVARTGMAAPGTAPGVILSMFPVTGDSLALNAMGDSAFISRLTGPGIVTTNDLGIWAEYSGSLSFIMRTGMQAPGTDPGVVFGGLGGVVPSIAFNNAGHVGFIAHVTGPGVTSTTNHGLWTGVAGSLSLNVREGMAAPGTAAGVHFSDVGLSEIGLNNAGQVVFRAFIEGPGVVNGVNHMGIWTAGPGSDELVARNGDQAPGKPDGVNFFSFGDPIINGSGDKAFRATLTGVPGTSVWLERDGLLSSVPGSNSSSLGDPVVLNALGQVAFTVGSSALWATDPDGDLHEIVRAGDPLEIRPGDVRTVQGVSIWGGSGGEDGRPTPFGDDGTLAFRIEYSGGSGIFVATVPEPTTSALFIAGAMFTMRRRSARRLRSM